MKKIAIASGFFLITVLVSFVANAQAGKAKGIQVMAAPVDAKLVLPAGFSSTIVADGVAGARHIAVSRQGGIYIKLAWLNEGKGIVYLKDTNHDGLFDQQQLFGNYPGTGICIRDNYLYASSNDDVYRYALDKNGEVLHPDQPEKIITGLVNHDRDNSKSITTDGKGHIYVNVGSYSNSCLLDPNSKKAPNPCPLLDSVGGIWQFNTAKLNQHQGDGVHYATGFKNVVGLDWNSQVNALYIMEHNRGQLHELYPEYYTEEQGDLTAAETMYKVTKGSTGGWPYVYYDHFQHKQILSPEYGGDGKKTATKKYQDPTMAFPAHLAPNGLLFYTGNQFPAKYKNGAFIAFHGRSAQLKKGYLVAFVPMKNGQPSGPWEIFADNIMLEKELHKPCGLAQGPDGSLYVTDDTNGRIYKISYKKG
ncbi:PQQ-dependent sugar dehydrogenase [Flavihumibacter profundi]|uniref:PQQ-dependent sugar dehydrogenase n=1 Tax=Flavihumibacter profundi TaxID=2716883 RepID=UPI001CC3A4D1|nr:PQQ-dependent sugar dehydrogenase [Flavihumibacter profundi]MBZ5856032.1 PQQ-dependent sugar dehydrogenase [Flavihumibacter profundi]